MTRQLLLIIIFLTAKNIISQTNNKLLIGELTLNQLELDKTKVGDTLTFSFVKKPFAGSLKIHSDNSIYSWTTCVPEQKNYDWCKIGTWSKNEFITFKLNCKTITLKNIS